MPMNTKTDFPENWIPTFTRKIFDYDNPTADAIDIRDIAHALSLECRFGNQCPEHYSVAQHSIYVSQIVPAADKFKALMHDSTEAYISDMVSPFKRRFPAFYDYENNLWRIIMEKYGETHHMPQSVIYADRLALAVEARDVMGWDPVLWGLPAPDTNYRITPWPAKLAEARFLEAFKDLIAGMEYGRAAFNAGAVLA